jgi:hypothetical protein
MKHPQPAPIRIMDGDRLAATVTTKDGRTTVQPEPGYTITGATINVTVRKPRKPRTRKQPA